MRVDGVGCIGYMCYSLHQSAVSKRFCGNRRPLQDAAWKRMWRACVQSLYSIDQLRNGVSVAALTPHLSVNGSGDIAGLRIGCD